MHELSLMSDLMRKLDAVARAHGGARIARVTIRLGALSHLSPEHLREHFVEAARGTPAEAALLDVVAETDPADPHAQDLVLESVDLHA